MSKTMATYPKRLIEVDLPIKRISAHARREKSIRHGHISTLHIWWARRPLAACRAVLCASLWPDPADELCLQTFRDVAAKVLCDFAEKVRADRQLAELCTESWTRWSRTTAASLRADNPACWPDMRYALLDFIADFANWDASTVPAFLEAARLLTHVAHLSLTDPAFRLPTRASLDEIKAVVRDLPRPLLVDPFAGGGAIPLEALRVGADAFASDLNPVAVLLNKVVLEYIPQYGQPLADEVRKWGQSIKKEAEKELAEFYPKDADGATPIAYLWARTIICEGPGCGTEVPLMRSLWLAKKGDRSVALRLVPDLAGKRVDFEIIRRQHGKWALQDDPRAEVKVPYFDGTVRRGAATCPCCGYTTPVTSVRRQLKALHGGTNAARLFCIVTTNPGKPGRSYRLPTARDMHALANARLELEKREREQEGTLSLLPDEPTPEGIGSGAGRAFSQRNYGMNVFSDLYTSRQLLTLSTFARIIREVDPSVLPETVRIVLALALGRLNDLSMSLCRWLSTIEAIAAANGGQNRMPVILDFVEANPLGGSGGDWLGQVDWVARVASHLASSDLRSGTVGRGPAQIPFLPSASADVIFTDPPYYDAFPYSDLSDFFYIWLKRALRTSVVDYREKLVPKDDEVVVYDVVHGNDGMIKDSAFFQREMTKSFGVCRGVAKPDAIGVVVFANKTTQGWEALIQSIIDAGWVATASWPIDTERPNRQRAIASAALGSSVHLVCRPREREDRALYAGDTGDWREILAEAPRRIHAWLPRLAQEGVVGADAIFACLGPALEIFSRYDRVEKASGEQVTLKEYLEHVWGAVAKEALTIIFAEADASGLEEDARLTAMWLWTLSTGGANGNGAHEEDEDDLATANDSEAKGKSAKLSGFVLEYDAARKIAQGLGVHLERLGSLVQIKGDQARLLPVAERARHLFGKNEAEGPARRRRESAQLSFLEVVDQAEDQGAEWLKETVARAGDTVLDRVHQAMLLFAAGRSDALKRFVVTEGIGRDARFWRLAQALSALYPSSSDEKRWVDGVLARKKGLGF
jgi:putative DNA methylase